MEKATSVTAALDAGKLPSQSQINDLIDWFNANALDQLEPSDSSTELSAQGAAIANGLRNVLDAYKQLGQSKNADNKLQQALWHLSSGDLSSTSVDIDIDSDDASNDIQQLRTALRTLLDIVWANIASQGTVLLQDFSSFTRLALADAAEFVEAQASRTKQSLRDVQSEVDDGQRDHLGRKHKSDAETQHDQDPNVQFQKGMDTAKYAGSSVIGAAQSASSSAKETYENTSNKLKDAYFSTCERAQNDPEYRKSLSTLFSTIEKWLTRIFDATTTAAADLNDSTSLESFINDPTPEQHVPNALRCIRSLVERLARGKSLDDLFAQLRACAIDVRADDHLKRWFSDFFQHVRKSLEEPGYARSEDAEKTFQDLRTRWKEFLKDDSNKGRKWKEDITALRRELSAFEDSLVKDKDLRRVREAHAKFGKDVEAACFTAGTEAIGFAMDQAAWFWQDLFKVYVPRLLRVLKDIPIPRTEYADADVELVLEDLDISAFNVLPSHVYIRNLTDIDITASPSQTSTAIGTMTHIRIQAMQLTLKDVSFYYRDKSATLGPAEFTGILEFALPKQGVDVDLKVRMLPNTPEGYAQRAKQGGFHVIEHVHVKVSEDVELNVTQSNHPVVLSVFRPIVTMRVRESLERALAAQIRAALSWADAMAWDVGRRAEVFGDTGLSRGPSLAAAIWSEVGRMRRMDGRSAFTGWTATGTGLVKDDRDVAGAAFAMGVEPQILAGEKQGPKGTFSEPIADKLPGVDVDSAAQLATEAAGGVVESAKEVVKTGKEKVKSFKQSVEAKAAEERKQDGWKSSAFDISA